MSRRIEIVRSNAPDYFCFKLLTVTTGFCAFDCGIPEYNDYLTNDAIRSMNDHIALTWLLTERASGKIAAYMSLIMDAIKLSFTEKDFII